MKEQTRSKELHPTEDNLIKLIRRLKNGRLFLKVRDGLPMVAEVAEGRKVVLNTYETQDD
jgi:hypothetical protein